MEKTIIAEITRKVSKTGGSLTLRLPKDWANANKVKVGDFLKCEILSDGSLRVVKNEH